jgi:hypothetical protein
MAKEGTRQNATRGLEANLVDTLLTWLDKFTEEMDHAADLASIRGQQLELEGKLSLVAAEGMKHRSLALKQFIEGLVYRTTFNNDEHKKRADIRKNDSCTLALRRKATWQKGMETLEKLTELEKQKRELLEKLGEHMDTREKTTLARIDSMLEAGLEANLLHSDTKKSVERHCNTTEKSK